MNDKIKWIQNSMVKQNGTGASTELFNKMAIEKAINFHRTFPDYQPTPLRELSKLANNLGVGGIYVKDESYRFGLNAFKALGGSYAIGRYLAKRLNKDISELPFEVLTSPEVKEQLGDITFATTTDGNHGRGIAWTARQLRQKSVVYMPKGSSQYRLERIRSEGATAEITDMNYDDAVRMTAVEAEKHGWVVVQDTSWEGYEEIPSWIMQGYGTMAAESIEQLNNLGIEKPTHIFVQAGVGALAGSVQGYFASLFKEGRPETVIVEADQADCLYKSALAADGRPRVVGGDMATVMAGLACGEPNLIGWNILRDYSDVFVSCPDWVAAKGMRVLANPLLGDPKVISGESGAVTAGLLSTLMIDEGLKEAREALHLDEKSQILLFNTEGNTDPFKYRSIVWDGELPSAGR
ncbi:diaminopropionate ammonia-lyase [Desulfosporosinus nitroreducens]|uniref:Diaminopropionate ammonia-lyase n=1 Tax=Desulfosporosinus nitroreducens TaxID=2018668 RepID=A0ABT8QRP5_9FIRM|nr:diaminopropionate ammonia-lyase [Desulfosporosinus nitroreducens]MCO1603938.1 diaminopropionate ammonia-lyase [Desulfosporosinus nitroreducens]MDO0822556.1 diaminopropionate ammonia-lyase [Desulfosporosinus nitroreducens]